MGQDGKDGKGSDAGVTGAPVSGGAANGGAVNGGAVSGGAVSGGAVSGGAVSGAAVTGAARDVQRPPFDEEIRSAIAYERGLFFKALLALALVAIVVVLRALFLT